jgi:hypothetical protein
MAIPPSRSAESRRRPWGQARINEATREVRVKRFPRDSNPNGSVARRRQSRDGAFKTIRRPGIHRSKSQDTRGDDHAALVEGPAMASANSNSVSGGGCLGIAGQGGSEGGRRGGWVWKGDWMENQKAGLRWKSGFGLFLKGSAATYSRASYTCTTIGNAVFDGRVRDGIGSGHRFMATVNF